MSTCPNLRELFGDKFRIAYDEAYEAYSATDAALYEIYKGMAGRNAAEKEETGRMLCDCPNCGLEYHEKESE